MSKRNVPNPKNATHGMSASPEYKSWACMVQRCHNPKYRFFKDYGGRGISVCDEWKNSFAAFFAHVGLKPTTDHSIDRIDNNGNYEPGNVRWATVIEQRNNKRTNRILCIDGQTGTVAEWARKSGMAWDTIWARVEAGWDHKDAISTPIRGPRLLTAFGITKTIGEWAKEYAISWKVLESRIAAGWDASKSLTTPVKHRSASRA